MIDYTISETYKLPSLGKLYKDCPEDVTLRSMTITDEMNRLSNSEKQYKSMCDLIDRCIISEIPISVYDMHIGDYQFLLHKLRVVTYGSDYKLTSQCPYCKFSSTETINLDDLKVISYTDDFNSLLSFDLPQTKKHITLKYQTPRMLDEIEDRSKDIRKKTNGKTDRGMLITLMCLIDTVDDKKLDSVELESFIQRLPMRDANVIFQKAQKVSGALGIDTDLEVDCEVCGTNYHTTFRQNSEFFRPTI